MKKNKQIKKQGHFVNEFEKRFRVVYEMHKELGNTGVGGLAYTGRVQEIFARYYELLNLCPGDVNLQVNIAGLCLSVGWTGLAIVLLERALQKSPDNIPILQNLGAAHYTEQRNTEAQFYWQKGIDLGGDTDGVLSNSMASLFCDAGWPDKAIKYCDEAIQKNPENFSALWHKSLALLTKGDFTQGMPLYVNRKKLPQWDNRDTVDAPQWDGRTKVGSLYIHGEQGVGDEIMFASMLRILHDSDECPKTVVLECHKKLVVLFKLNFPKWCVVEKAPHAHEKVTADAKCAMGDFMGFKYRALRWADPKPYLAADPDMVKSYRTRLKALGPGPYYALSWRGGMKNTRVHVRSFPLSCYEVLLSSKATCVSVQYACGAGVDDEREAYDLPKLSDESCGDGDLHHQAALLQAVDNVFACQSAVGHLAGAVGKRTTVFIPHNPQWRYGLQGPILPWYGDFVGLRRKPQNVEWEKFIPYNLRGYLF